MSRDASLSWNCARREAKEGGSEPFGVDLKTVLWNMHAGVLHDGHRDRIYSSSLVYSAKPSAGNGVTFGGAVGGMALRFLISAKYLNPSNASALSNSIGFSG